MLPQQTPQHTPDFAQAIPGPWHVSYLSNAYEVRQANEALITHIPGGKSDDEAAATAAESLTLSFTGRCKGCGVSIIRDRDFCDECSSRGDESPLPE